jgi:DNA polymerase elongation subunit (family B)
LIDISALTDQELLDYEKEVYNDSSKYDNFQLAIKILINSAYGACANENFRYFKLTNAEAITLSGQMVIKWAERNLNKYLNKLLQTDNFDYVIMVDTDSTYLNLQPLIQKYENKLTTLELKINFIDKFCEQKINPFLADQFQKLATYGNCIEQKIHMKRESIADKGVVHAKKRYMLSVWDSEGTRYSDPYIKIMGLESVRSSTPEICRNKIKDTYKLILKTNKDTVVDFIENFKTTHCSGEPEDVAFPRGVSDLEKYACPTKIYKKGTPIHVRGALLYNHHIKKLKLENDHQLIRSGEKIKFMYLKMPNPIHENVISFPGVLPKALDLHPYIDYQLQFEKTYLDPINNILKSARWVHQSIEENTLEEYFV